MKSAFIIAFLAGVTAFPFLARAECPLSIKTPFSAVALFKRSFLERLENENRLKEICPEQDKECMNKALSAQIDTIPVYYRPSGKIVANLKITYPPGKEITATLTHGKRTVSFVPPIYDADWGYGPWFHATLLDQKGSWKKIALPLIQSGWIELPQTKILHLAEKDTVYSLNDRHIVIIKSTETSLTIRDEQPADKWCEEGEPPPLVDFKEETIPLSQVYDDKCNLLLSPAYTRGC